MQASHRNTSTSPLIEHNTKDRNYLHCTELKKHRHSPSANRSTVGIELSKSGTVLLTKPPLARFSPSEGAGIALTEKMNALVL